MPLKPLTHAERVRIFGHLPFRPQPTPANPERVRVTSIWAHQNLREFRIEQLAKLGANPNVTFHYKVGPKAVALFAAWEAAGLLGHLKTWNGSWVARFKRGHAGGTEADLSNHAWGTAFDVDAARYPLGKPVPLDAPIRELVPLAESFGFAWGGNFGSRPDGMHWELVQL